MGPEEDPAWVRASAIVRVLRTSVAELDRLSESQLNQRIAQLETELAACDAGGSEWELEYELGRCRRALQPDWKQAYHARGCYVLDQRHIRRPTLEIPLTDVPSDAHPCQICAPSRPISGHANAGAPGITGGPSEDRSATVRIGSTVEVVDEETSRRLQYTILDSGARASLGQISAGAPIAQALLDGRIGDVRIARLPSAERRFRIIRIEDPA